MSDLSVPDIDHLVDGCVCEGKKCSKCEVSKCIEAFGIQKNLPSGRRSCCKECRRAYVNEYRKEHGRKKVLYRPKVLCIDPPIHGSKRCYACEKEKDHSLFYKDKYQADGYANKCKECKAKLSEGYKPQNRHTYEYRRVGKKIARLKTDVEGSSADFVKFYEDVLDRQGGVCAICGKTEDHRNQHGVKRLAIDHDHSTGAFRGLLCGRCNIGLGQFRDDPELLLKAIAYLQNSGVQAM